MNIVSTKLEPTGGLIELTHFGFPVSVPRCIQTTVFRMTTPQEKVLLPQVFRNMPFGLLNHTTQSAEFRGDHLIITDIQPAFLAALGNSLGPLQKAIEQALQAHLANLR